MWYEHFCQVSVYIFNIAFNSIRIVRQLIPLAGFETIFPGMGNFPRNTGFHLGGGAGEALVPLES